MSASHKSQGKPSKASQERPPVKHFKINKALLLLGGIILLGLVLRLLPALYCIVDGNVIFMGPDSYYHMRRIALTIAHYPIANMYDSYVSYPYGFQICWPPLFDVVAATAALLVGLGHPDTYTMEVVSSLVPVLMGIAVIVLTYFIARDALNEKAALIAALIMAMLPAGVFRSLFGVVDHPRAGTRKSSYLWPMYLLFHPAQYPARGRRPRMASKAHARPCSTRPGAARPGCHSQAQHLILLDGLAPIFVGVSSSTLVQIHPRCA